MSSLLHATSIAIRTVPRRGCPAGQRCRSQRPRPQSQRRNHGTTEPIRHLRRVLRQVGEKKARFTYQGDFSKIEKQKRQWGRGGGSSDPAWGLGRIPKLWISTNLQCRGCIKARDMQSCAHQWSKLMCHLICKHNAAPDMGLLLMTPHYNPAACIPMLQLRARLIAIKTRSINFSQTIFFNKPARTRKNRFLRQIPGFNEVRLFFFITIFYKTVCLN